MKENIIQNIKEKLPNLNFKGKGLYFTYSLWEIWDLSDLIKIAVELSSDFKVIILKGFEEGELEPEEEKEIEQDDELLLLPIFFKTHCYGSYDWGWTNGFGFSEIKTSGTFNKEQYHEIEGVEDTLLVIADPKLLFDKLVEIGLNENIKSLELNILKDIAPLALGTSCHNGDFVWFDE